MQDAASMDREYYSATSKEFYKQSTDSILGTLTRRHSFALEDLQRNAWITQIDILKSQIERFPGAYIIFEYSIPRMGKRADVIILLENQVFVLEFKVGASEHTPASIEQTLDYAVDLKNFHEQSHSVEIVPVLVSTEARSHELNIEKYLDGVYRPILANKGDFSSIIIKVSNQREVGEAIMPNDWLHSVYKPTPTIIEAAQALYRGHTVKEISRSDSGAKNLGASSKVITRIIESSKQDSRKSICFLTGVPGAGKTLAGLNIANKHHDFSSNEHAVFLSGNGPLVQVLQEGLARNQVSEKKRLSVATSKSAELTKTKAFIQNIHHFRDDMMQNTSPPVEHIVIFDEAQRAWTMKQTCDFMARKKGVADFSMSEPEFLISALDRHDDWAVIICLIGGGQEINTGEAGLPEWFSAIQKSYPHWDVYTSKQLRDQEYTNGQDIYSLLTSNSLTLEDDLHLSVSIRSYRAEKLADFVKAVLDSEINRATALFAELKNTYPIVLTRNLETAKGWLKSKARGGEGIGITASSGAYRLKPYGIHIKSKIEPKNWFLNGKSDVRSAGFLEDVATEFDIQGLELDWTCVAWDADLRKTTVGWEFKSFKGTKWQNISDDTRKRYLLNAYRVLLTRARQGLVIFIPEGDCDDATRLPGFYDPVYEYLTECGVPCIDNVEV